MKLQRTTLLLLVAALLLSGVVFVLEIQGRPTREAAQAKQQQIFTFAEKQVQSLKIITPSQTIEIAQAQASEKPDGSSKNTKEDTSTPNGAWNLQSPVQAPANEATITYLLSLLVSEKRDRTLKVAPGDLAEMGLEQPKITLEITLTNRKTHRLLVGNPDFSGQSLYVQVDPAKTQSKEASAEIDVDLVPISLQGAIDRPLDDWKASSENVDKPKDSEQTKPEQSPAN